MEMESDAAYRIIFTGELLPEQEKQVVYEAVGQLLKKDRLFIANLFDKAPIVIVKNASHKKALKWKEALKRAGVGCRIELIQITNSNKILDTKNPAISRHQDETGKEPHSIQESSVVLCSNKKNSETNFEDILLKFKKQISSETISIAPDIRKDRLAKASINLNVARNEIVLLIVDSTNRQSMKSGLVLTDRAIYYRRAAMNSQSVSLGHIRTFGIKKGFLKSLLVNDSEEICSLDRLSEDQIAILYQFLREILIRYKNRQPDNKEDHGTETSTDETIDLIRALEWISFEEMLKCFASEISGPNFTVGDAVTDAMLLPFQSSEEERNSMQHPVAFFNASDMFSKSPTGLLLTPDLLYKIDADGVRKQTLHTIRSMEFVRMGELLLYINGAPFFRLEKDNTTLFPHVVQLFMFRCGCDYNASYFAKMISRDVHWNECPHCHSTEIESDFDYGKGFSSSTVITGLTGSHAVGTLVGGLIGQHKGKAIRICQRCKYRWKPEPLPNPFGD